MCAVVAILSGCTQVPVAQDSGEQALTEMPAGENEPEMVRSDADAQELQQVQLPASAVFRQQGIASWYGKSFNGHRTASGERFDMNAMTAAHRTLPLGSYVRVTLARTGKSVIVRINDRGPFTHHRIIDLSYAAASVLGIQRSGAGLVAITLLRSMAND
ncbi:septal ring lytic transglycosylase RlpA family protein [Burkholderia lata]|uniref:septal ring lytic transglycosylase RlpA family protein n=1 Tax=Burkholderia lata (strain ATCC 17760 / DSM 23089 / LMG 22485 / NCIMB 9086 / R18194 / 383) TaxID=482957 RepID=UPI0015843991